MVGCGPGRLGPDGGELVESHLLAERLRTELRAIEQVVERAENAVRKAHEQAQDRVFFAASAALDLHGFYAGVERLFELIASDVDQNRPTGGNWHRDLLAQMALTVADGRAAPPIFWKGIISMATNEYHFIAYWRVQSTLEEVSAIIGNAPDLVRWWPSVYLDVQELEPGGKDGLGRIVSLYTKGWLPYTLRWQFRVTESRYPHGFTLEAWGDFVGRGIWTFRQDGDWVSITYDWKVRADKLLLRYFSFVMKPIFSANHHWAMRIGEESLKLELARRHAATPEERARIPHPPGPTFAMFGRGGV